MFPTIPERCLALNEHISILTHSIRRHDIVMLKSPIDPSKIICKRVIGLPGDQIALKISKSDEHLFLQQKRSRKSSMLIQTELLEDNFQTRSNHQFDGDDEDDDDEEEDRNHKKINKNISICHLTATHADESMTITRNFHENENEKFFFDIAPDILSTKFYFSKFYVPSKSNDDDDGNGDGDGIIAVHIIPNNHLWIEGDNKLNSLDSRFYGPVPYSLIESKVYKLFNFFS
ncbi:hypothetical protein SNEBB_004121 [Seison nebaliae]|nr:hypothetical protein SNEBB_004121 [Seison nebaliae]